MSNPSTPQPTSPTTTSPTTTTTTAATTTTTTSFSSKAQNALHALSLLLGSLPDSLSSSETPALSLLHHPDIANTITSSLRQPVSGAGNDDICRWLYDTFHTSDPDLQLVVLSFLPTLAGVYLSRTVGRKSLPGFEAVLLALYAHETTARNGQALTVTIPDISHPSLYHETTKVPAKNTATEVHIAVMSPSLEPHGTVRATKRARIIGVALELFYSKISRMPMRAKLDFCEHCRAWAGQNGEIFKETEMEKKISSKSSSYDGINTNSSCNIEEGSSGVEARDGRIPLTWDLWQPSLRILSHCWLGSQETELKEAAAAAIRSLHARALHDMDPRAILASWSLLKVGKLATDSQDGLNSSFWDEHLETDRIVLGTS